jgi:bis(5'-nucleosyl)-tetraphosphatase (symmetrical)
MELDARPVLGNHDLHLLDVARGHRELGKSDTLDKLLAADDAPELLSWLAAQPLLRIHKDLYQVHAGLHPAWTSTRLVRAALELTRGARAKAATAFATRARFCDKSGALPSKSVVRNADGDPTNRRWQPWYRFYDYTRHNGRYVVYGHWAVMGVVDRAATIGLDSGCVWGGALTAYIPEERLIVSVPAQRAYAGNFRPR